MRDEGLNPWRQKGEYWLNTKVSEIPLIWNVRLEEINGSMA